MKKILPILIVIIFVLSGLEAVAIPSDKKTEIKPLNMQDFELEIAIEGGFFGYTVTVTNVGTEQVSGNLLIEITTIAMYMLLGGNLAGEFPLELDPDDRMGDWLRPLLGFGSAPIISISGVFLTEDGEYPFETTASGFVWIIYIQCDVTTINLP